MIKILQFLLNLLYVYEKAQGLHPRREKLKNVNLLKVHLSILTDNTPFKGLQWWI